MCGLAFTDDAAVDIYCFGNLARSKSLEVSGLVASRVIA